VILLSSTLTRGRCAGG